MNKENSYHKIMEYLVVTPEMEHRILANLEHACAAPTASHLSRKQIGKMAAGLAACAVLAISLSTFLPHTEKPSDESSPPPMAGVPDVTVYDTPKALSDALSYPLMLPATLPNPYLLTAVQRYAGELAECVYSSGTDEIVYRMSPGTEDNSGDWNEYETLVSAPAEDGTKVILKGSANGFSLAVWTDGTNAFSISTTVPLSKETLLGIISGVSPLP